VTIQACVTHFTTKMVCKPPIGVKNRKVSTAYFTHAQLLVTRSTRSVRQLLQLPLCYATVSEIHPLSGTEKQTSLSAFSVFKASIAAISLMDSSTLPCSPERRLSAICKFEIEVCEYLGFRSCPFRLELPARFRLFPSSMVPFKSRLINECNVLYSTARRKRTRLVVLAFSSGVFSRCLCAARMRRSHSSTNEKMFDSYSIWKRLKTGSLGFDFLAERNSSFNRSVCNLGHTPRSIFCVCANESR
jgi:hypothetical protein